MSITLDANIARPYRDGWISWLEMLVVIDEISEKLCICVFVYLCICVFVYLYSYFVFWWLSDVALSAISPMVRVLTDRQPWSSLPSSPLTPWPMILPMSSFLFSYLSPTGAHYMMISHYWSAACLWLGDPTSFPMSRFKHRFSQNINFA